MWLLAGVSVAEEGEGKAATTSLKPGEIEGFEENPDPVKAMLEEALELMGRGLGYKYGSADPDAGGMDCSGAIYYLLTSQGVEGVPRSSSAMYRWAWENGRMYPVSSSSLKTFELSELKPGDLLFWSGTYDIDREPPITHVMIYLGEEKGSGRRVMVGASNGRSYKGVAQHGVSVFDFKLPTGKARAGRTPRFCGYVSVPGLVPEVGECGGDGDGDGNEDEDGDVDGDGDEDGDGDGAAGG
ncbi:hypothetical protein BH23VER1_BH23VER1_07450 [soil metagenome]